MAIQASRARDRRAMSGRRRARRRRGHHDYTRPIRHTPGSGPQAHIANLDASPAPEELDVRQRLIA